MSSNQEIQAKGADSYPDREKGARKRRNAHHQTLPGITSAVHDVHVCRIASFLYDDNC
jgi:hypothetical protein